MVGSRGRSRDRTGVNRGSVIRQSTGTPVTAQQTSDTPIGTRDGEGPRRSPAPPSRWHREVRHREQTSRPWHDCHSWRSHPGGAWCRWSRPSGRPIVPRCTATDPPRSQRRRRPRTSRRSPRSLGVSRSPSPGSPRTSPPRRPRPIHSQVCRTTSPIRPPSRACPRGFDAHCPTTPRGTASPITDGDGGRGGYRHQDSS